MLLSINVMRSIILGAMNDLSLLIFENAFMYWNISLVGDKKIPERIISC